MKHKKTELVERNVQQPVKAFSILEEGDGQDLFSTLLGSCNDAVRLNDVKTNSTNMTSMPVIVQNCYGNDNIFVDPIICAATCSALDKIQELNTLLKEDVEATKAAFGAENVRQSIMRFGDNFINIVTECINLQQNKMEYNAISCALAILKEAGFEVQIPSNNRIINRYNSTLGFEFRNFWTQSKKMPTHKDYVASTLISGNSISQATMNLYRDFIGLVMQDFIMRYPGKDVNIVSQLTYEVFLAFHDSLLDMANIIDDLNNMILQDEELCKFLSNRTRYRDEYNDWDGQF